LESTRLQKIARLVQKELSEIFRLETAKMGGVLVSVSSVRVSPDLSIAHIYLSVFPTSRQDEIIKKVEEDQKTIRFELGNLEHNQLRIIPELHFHIDETLDRMEHIDQLLAH